VDLSWLAVDRDGHVAWLVTFGSAVVPGWLDAQARASDGKSLELIADVEEMLAALPERSELGASNGDDAAADADWRDSARRGMFAFDWAVYSGPYRVVAAPKTPLHVDELPRAMADLAKRSSFKEVCFLECSSLGVADVKRCLPSA
jgi:hypothetical protein